MDFKHTWRTYKNADLSGECEKQDFSYQCFFDKTYCILPNRESSPWANCIYQTKEQESIIYMGKMYRCTKDTIEETLKVDT